MDFPRLHLKMCGVVFILEVNKRYQFGHPRRIKSFDGVTVSLVRLDLLTFAQPLLQSLRYLYFLLPATSHHHMQSIYHRVSMGWWLLRLSAKILALLRLSVNLFQLRLTKKLKINFFSFKELNINKPVFFVSLSKIKVLGVSRDEISYSFETF